jgi:hypothetical protein
MKLVNFTPADARQLEYAKKILAAVSPYWAQHAERVLHVAIVDAKTCAALGPRVVACTMRKRGVGTVWFARHPSADHVLNVVENIRHEAHHHQIKGKRVHRMKHTCSDPLCSKPNERACDPIYKMDAAWAPHFKRHYDKLVAAATPKPPPKKAAGGILAVLGVAAAFAVFFVVAISGGPGGLAKPSAGGAPPA